MRSVAAPRLRALAALAILPFAACAPAANAPPNAPPPCVAPPPAASIAAAPPPATPAPATDVYLPPSRAGGARFCLDPDSRALRAAIKRDRFTETDTLDGAALAADVRDLHEAMKRHYAGYPILRESPRFDVDAFFTRWEDDARAAGPAVPFARGILEPLVEIRHHIRDNHLSVWGWGGRLVRRADLAFSEYQAAGRIEGLDAAKCEFGVAPVAGTVRVVPLLGRAAHAELSTFSAQSTVPFVDVRCGGRSTRFERRQVKRLEHPDKAPVYEWRVVGDAAVIVVRRLYGSPEQQALLTRIAADYPKHRTHPVVVFDFRGNGGGNDGYVNRWTELARRGTWPAPYIERKVAGGRAACVDWNALVADQISYDRVDDPAAREERAALRKKLDAEAAEPEPAPALSEVTETSDAKNPYTGRVFALVDAGSGSSGESAPDELRTALGATLVGERTGGYLEFGNVRPHVMARTGVVWQLASKENFYATPHDGVGLPVDVYLPADLLAAPVEELLPLLTKLRPAKP